jgi:hypothetical protein
MTVDPWKATPPQKPGRSTLSRRVTSGHFTIDMKVRRKIIKDGSCVLLLTGVAGKIRQQQVSEVHSPRVAHASDISKFLIDGPTPPEAGASITWSDIKPVHPTIAGNTPQR